MFSNLRGCDGERVYFNGLSSITLNGKILTRASQFAIEEVEVTAATVDLEEIRDQCYKIFLFQRQSCVN